MPALAVLASTPGTKPPADPPPVPRWFERPGTALLLVLLTVALRRPDTLFHPQFEAEDGPVFFGQITTSAGTRFSAHTPVICT